MVGWPDGLQRRNRAVGVIIAVVSKYLDDQGGYLAARPHTRDHRLRSADRYRVSGSRVTGARRGY